MLCSTPSFFHTSTTVVPVTIWGTTSDTNIIGKLQKIQNRGMSIILRCHHRTHIEDMLSNLKWLSNKQRIMFLTAVPVFKIMHSKTPNYMSHWLVPVSHQYGTRRSTSGNLFVPRSHPNSQTTKGTRLHSNSPKPQDIKKNTAFFIAHDFNIYYSQIHITFINQDYWFSRISQSILNQFLWNSTHTIFHSCRDYPENFEKFW